MSAATPTSSRSSMTSNCNYCISIQVLVGKEGFQKVRTMIRFVIDHDKVKGSCDYRDVGE